MNRKLLWLVILAALAIAALVYRSTSTHLDVNPQAGREIEKAKQR